MKASSPIIHRFDLTPESTRRLAIAFTLFLLVFETYAVGVNNSAAFLELFKSDNGWFLSIALVFVVGSLYLVYRFFYAAFASGWACRIVYLFLLTASLGVEYSYQKALGRFSEPLDVELALATTWAQKVESIGMYIGIAAVVPVFGFIIALLVTRGRRERSIRDLCVINGLLIASLLVGSIVSVSQFPTVSIVAFYRTSVEFAIAGSITDGAFDLVGSRWQRKTIAVPELAAGHVPDNNIVLVIDESVRGDHFSLNGYGRPTTPFLDDLHRKGLLHNWGIAAAGSTGSHTSFNTLMTGLTPDDFPDPGQQKLKTSPTIFQYARAMGYTTWLFDGQMDYFWSGIRDDRRHIDNWVPVTYLKDPKAAGDWDIDVEIAKRVNKTVSGSKGNFIIVFKHGSHVPYHLNFPPDRAVWQPSYINDDRFSIPGPKHLNAVANAYDNSILYNVNSFFPNLIDDYERIPNNTVILYTGDHGQTLFVNGKASHSGHTRQEATVPLLIIGTLPDGVDTGYKASHSNVYPTILDLMGYPAEMRELRFGLSLLKAKAADSRPRYFNPSYGPKVAFDF